MQSASVFFPISGFYITNAVILTLFVARKSISRLDVIAVILSIAGIAFSVVPVIRHANNINQIGGKEELE